MMSKKFIKGMCIFLAGLMILSAIAVLFQVFAAGTYVPDTGVDEISTPLLVVGIVLCLLIIVMCIALPKMKKKDNKKSKKK